MSESDANEAQEQPVVDEEAFDDLFFSGGAYDPLAASDTEINQEEMDDDNPWDTVDYPTMREMPEHMQRPAVFTPEKCGSAREALESLLDHNPGRKSVLLMILDTCRDGCPSSEVTNKVVEFQNDDYSVYEPMTLCRMLERAGVLELTMPQVAEEHEDVEEGVEYLEIKERIDPVWTSTADGLAVYDDQMSGSYFREIVFDRDVKYREVYYAVLDLIRRTPCKVAEVEKLTDSFEVTQHPKRFGGHFIDMLERTDAIRWQDHAWHITELGERMYAELGKTGEGDE